MPTGKNKSIGLDIRLVYVNNTYYNERRADVPWVRKRGDVLSDPTPSSKIWYLFQFFLLFSQKKKSTQEFKIV
jgi:hypothetical protein